MPQLPVIPWLLDSDPAIRWQVLRDLTDAPAADVAAERAKVATSGLGAALLAQQKPDGSWAGVAWNHGWDSTMHALTLLREFGLDPATPAATQAVAKVRDQVRWIGWDVDGQWHGENHLGAPFFMGEVEPCINGQVAADGSYFRQDVQHIISRLLREQLPDGGWNCEAERGSTRSSFNTTICVLEALLEHERSAGPARAVRDARLRGQEYLLERRLFRRKSTGQTVDTCRKCGSSFTKLAFPNWWHYDVLRALDYLRAAGVNSDDRLSDAIDLIESKRDSDGRWRLEVIYPGRMPVDLGETEGQPSRWLTLRAMRVLKWFK